MIIIPVRKSQKIVGRRASDGSDHGISKVKQTLKFYVDKLVDVNVMYGSNIH